LEENPLYSRLDYVKTVSTVGGCAWCTFSWLMVGLMWLLHFFSSFLFGNYGLAIILLVLIVRVLLHPLTKKSQISMAKMSKAMAALKPQMDKIKEKYANDKAAQQRETMKLYKEHGNPMANMLGCLPMLLQMPIWIALYSGLNSEVALRHAAFLPFWITDLAAPDQLFSWKEPLWLIGNSFNLLPILVAVGMFLQTKFNPAMASQSASPDQAQQQKMMKYMMPLMMLFIFFKAPSGLNLYIMASTMGGVLEQYFIRRHIREQEELQAASETFVKVSGKGPRGARPKKNKGSFWVKRG
ncbi:MAG TPA: membrane protein insertase YidC, partial [Phycisphaerae bacterium]|nr:membrane protein insertase YidC [Phycisphaerae bacterium]